MQPPHFVIAGHPKCGSTTLQGYLSAHPALWMGPIKEPSLYLDHWQDWETNQLHYYPSDLSTHLLRGDATVGYVKDSRIAKRIAHRNPASKIIFLVRDPIRRALSHYHHWLRHGKDVRPLSEVIYHSDWDHYFYLFGRYGTHLQLYQEYFDPTQIHVLFFEDLIQNPKDTLAPLWQFLEVQPLTKTPEPLWENAGHGVNSRRLSRWLKVQKESTTLRAIFPKPLRKLGGSSLRALERWNRSTHRQQPTADQLSYMQARFAPEITMLKSYMEQHQPATQVPVWMSNY